MTMKELKDYAHLYLGCEVARNHYDGELEYGKLVGVSQSEIEPDRLVTIIDVGLDHFHEWYVDETILILRHIDRMTEEETKEYNERKQRKGYMFRVYAENTMWLLSKGFDLFGLIPAGLAVDKKTLNP